MSNFLVKLEKFYSNNKSMSLLYNVPTCRPWIIGQDKIILKDLLRRRNKIYDNKRHITCALQWIKTAQQATDCGGISAGYYFNSGWALPYPEISGYIIPTLVDCGLVEESTKIADWLLSIQNDVGSFNTGWYYNDKLHRKTPLMQKILLKSLDNNREGIFESGQILWGMISIYEKTKDRIYLDAAMRISKWLACKWIDDGYWEEIVGSPRAWSVLTASQMAKMSRIVDSLTYKNIATAQADLTLSFQKENGWFSNCSQTTGNTDDAPWTHGIGYTLQGLLEIGIALDRQDYIGAVVKTCEKLLRIYSIKGFKSFYEQEVGFLPARFDCQWKSRDHFSCLVGNAQISLVWCMLYKVTGDYRYLNAAMKLNDDIKATQELVLDCPDYIFGGIKGSNPIWGLYCGFSYPAWAAKFFVDALIAEEDCLEKISK